MKKNGTRSNLLFSLAAVLSLAACQGPSLVDTTAAHADANPARSIPAPSNPTFNQAAIDAASWLVSQQDPSGLVDSFEDSDLSSYSYDQAIAAIALLLQNDIVHAKKILDTMKSLQAADGTWVNSYSHTNLGGIELRKHVGVITWMALAVMNYEKITGDTTTYHDMAIKAMDWCLTFAKSNGALSGGLTTWDSPPNWTPEVWSSTEHNEDAYAALTYFAATTPSKTAAYTAAAANSKWFLDNVVWDANKNRFRGGYKNNTGSVDYNVPMDVNPWGVLALGTSGTRNYGATIDYVENANANPGTTVDNPRYVHNLPYNGGSINLYDFDWESDGLPGSSASGGGVLGADVWFEGSAFMSVAYRMLGNTTKADAIITEMIKKQGKDGSKVGGVPYSLNGTNNNYWRMSNLNCISSTGWLIIAIHGWNPFTGTAVNTPPPGVTLPATIEAESYTAQNGGLQTEACSEGGLNVGWTDQGDWLEYVVNVPTAGTWTLEYRLAGYSGSLDLLVDGASQGTTAAPATGGWQSWWTVPRSVNLSAGSHTIRLLVAAGGFNINWLKFSQAAPSNLVANSGFEAEGPTQNPTGWSNWTPAGEVDADFTETYGGARTGTYHLTHWRTSAYKIWTYQIKTGLANGLYTLRVWTRSSGGQNQVYLQAKNFGGGVLTANIPASSGWVQESITNIPVSNGQCEFGIYSDANANNAVHIDDFELVRQ